MSEETKGVVSLSIDEICREVYAQSALRHLLDGDEARPGMLRGSHRDALGAVARREFTALCGSLGLMSVSFDGELMSAEVRWDGREPLESVRRRLEGIVGLRVLAVAYGGSDPAYSALLADRAGLETGALNSRLGARRARIKPTLF